MTTVQSVLQPPRLSQGIRALFRLVSRGAAGAIALRQHGGRQHETGVVVTAGDEFPPAVLTILLHSLSPWGVALAVRDPARGTPASVSVLAVRRTFDRQYRNPQDPASPFGKAWVFPEPEIEAWEETLCSWPIPATMLVRALPAVWALWALSDPLPAARKDAAARVLDLQQRLARAVDGDAGDSSQPSGSAAAVIRAVEDLEVPLMGTRSANQNSRVVTCTHLNESTVYPIAAIEAAIRRGKDHERGK